MMDGKKFIIFAIMTIVGLVGGLLFVEACLRLSKEYSSFGLAVELEWMRKNDYNLAEIFTLDPDLGFRPILGNHIFNKYGTKINDYSPQKKQDITRLLFIGDSVTARGKIIAALRQVYGENKYEYWNAGVESYNTVQEVEYYKKYNYSVNPDHVILTFHPNDFETTPIAFFHANRLVVYAPSVPFKKINPWLFKNSYIYRFILSIFISKNDRDSINREVKNSLKNLKHMLERDDISLTVLVLPFFKPWENWEPREKQSRKEIIKILKELKIKYFDLFPILNSAIEDGVNVQEKTGDFWHPSEEISTLFANYLFENKLLEQTKKTWGRKGQNLTYKNH